jgi:lipopolysaccharide/colanic/teichoic acid biosynthesis glycosyltransferase
MLSVVVRRQQKQRDRVVAVVNPDDAGVLRATVENTHPYAPYAEENFSLVAALCLGTFDEAQLRRELEASAVTVIVLSQEAQMNEQIVSVVASFHARGVRVRTLTGFYEEWLGKMPLSELGPMALMFDIHDVHTRRYAQFKRILDIFGSLFGLCLVGGVTPFILLGNALANRGPLFFRQARVGRNDETFTIMKFRTMYPSELRPDTPWTAPDDPRVTPFGRFLRTSHLDELPQMWNVLRGELSLVGPRPEQPHYVKELSSKNSFYAVRHAVAPGITGWAQVKFRYAASEADAFEKLQYDLYYLRHQSFSMDLRILSRTIRSIFANNGQ